MGRIIAIITAGGSGRRANSNIKKQFIQIQGRPVLFWTLDKFADHEVIDGILVVLPEDQISFAAEIRKEFPGTDIECIIGGKKRQDSVYNALLSCREDTEIVMIHDGVRPFITSEEITLLYQSAMINGAVIAAARVKNTIKSVADQKIERTIPRENLFNALTPQVFNYNLILKYHKKARSEGLYFTDDAAILEYYGKEVSIVECSSSNIKITDKQDIKLTELLLEKK